MFLCYNDVVDFCTFYSVNKYTENKAEEKKNKNEIY